MVDQKQKARSALNKALRAGKIERGTCEECGSEAVNAHHEDYARPLDVVWLCPRHHAARHVEHKSRPWTPERRARLAETQRRRHAAHAV